MRKAMEFTSSIQYKDNPILRETFQFAIEIVKYAESKADFIHKMKIALKEADETEYWLFLCEKLETYPNPEGLINKLTGIIKILNKIISSAKKNSPIR